MAEKITKKQLREKFELTDDEIYQLNEADTEAHKRFFWEAGLLDTCKA